LGIFIKTQKVRKLIRKDLSSDLFDTDFTYEDIAFYTHGIYTASNSEEIDHNGKEAYKLTIEKNDEYTSYSHTEVTILKSSLSMVESVMYDKENPDTPVKHLTFSNFEMIQDFSTPMNNYGKFT